MSPDQSPLAVLDRLAQRSKHREPLTLATVNFSNVEMGNGYIESLQSFDPGEPVIGEPMLVAAAGLHIRGVQMELGASFEIRGDDKAVSGRPAGTLLVGILDYVEDAVFRKLAPFA
jgi:hypothetical protein